MKRGLLLGTVAGMIALTGIMMYESRDSNDTNFYTERVSNKQVQNDGWSGAQAYLARIRGDQNTGEIDPAAVLRARQQAQRVSAKKSAIGLQWQNAGPNNIGGRTRSLLIDKDDNNIMYAGSVSGGLFRTTNAGLSWRQVNDLAENLAVICLEEAPDGTIYYGTGEGMYYQNSGDGSRGILGGGLFKSTDDGLSFQLVPSTQPTSNNPGSRFASIGKIEVDPNNAQRIFLATNRGLERSVDGGVTWNAVGGLGVGEATDMTMDSDGGIWVKQGIAVYYSPSGDDNTFESLQTRAGNSLGIAGPRARIAVAPTDANYVYIVNTTGGGAFKDAWQSKDKGLTWTKIGETSPILNPHRTQGGYNNALAVSPLDKEAILVGGVELWTWSNQTGWLQAASLSDQSVNFYVHADNHAIIFHPTKPNEIFVGNDGGVFKSSNNGITWTPLNKEYVSAQFYSIGVGYDGSLLGGTQDNGTLFISPKSFFPRQGVRTNSILYDGVLRDGDGGYAEISHLNTQMAFKEMQYGILGRTADSGESFNAFYDFNRMDPQRYSRDGGDGLFADFVMPFMLWENLNEPLSEDSVRFVNDSASTNLGFGSGGTTYGGQLASKQPTTKFVPDGMRITTGSGLSVSSTPLANPTDTAVTLTGDGTGRFNVVTGRFTVTFNSAVFTEIEAKAATFYNAGDVLFLKSATNEFPIEYTLPSDLNPGESVMVQDPVQATFFVGLRAYDTNTGSNRNRKGGVWMTREAISSPLVTPEWFHIADLGNDETPTTMQISQDGNTLYVGTNRSRLYRITNINDARDSASTEIDDKYVLGAIVDTNTSVIETSVIRSFSGRAITSIAVNQQNQNQIVVTLGNYGLNNTQYVYRCDNALSATPIFAAITGDLPLQPVYSSTFNYNDPTAAQLILGTEDGIYTTDDVNAASVTYTKENSGMANVPVFSIRQPRVVRTDLLGDSDFDGQIYLGTHGRGFYYTNTTAQYISVDESEPLVNRVEEKEQLNLFPNPARNEVNVSLNLTGRSDIKLSVRNLTGKQVKFISVSNVDRNVESLPLDISTLSNGTYLITLQVSNSVKTGKLVVVK